ncbi:general secretion pathway M protein [Psychromonas sp. CNPT3]|uniref:type II secretion system protein GspM n=1 Tax=Psychromonas sp. CNPT3 TaxID=314282 RepID=UPI00006E70A1|nr:type II secretion system protein M [Psychromonas sp. CNPT3]AGH80130.1 general secretion pathway M protein [Psychromonas sp. CNPT3]
MQEKWRIWWATSNIKERRLVVVIVLFLAFSLCYWGAWKPLSTRLDNSEIQLLRTQKTLSWVQEKASLLLKSGRGSQVAQVPQSSLVEVINRSAKRSGISFTRILNRNDTLEVWIADVEFNNTMDWLTLLKNKYGIEVLNVDINQALKPGYIKINRLVLGY